MNAYLIAINAKYIHTNPAVYDLRAYAKKHLSSSTCDLQVLEYTINEPLEFILRDIFQHRPDFLAFSCYIWNIRFVKELIVDLHQVLPDTPIYLGGPEVSYDAPALCREFPFLSGIMVGEGEQTLTDLLGNVPLPIPGLYTPDMNPADLVFRPCISMDDVPFFYEEYGNEPNLGPFEHKILYYETSRGCPFHCAYCLSSIEKEMRFRSLPLVEKELQFFLDRKVPQVKFIDRTFNAKKSHAMAIWTYLKEHDNGVTNFHFEIEPSLLNQEELDLLCSLRPGFFQLEIGVQSTYDKALAAVHRTNDLALLSDVVFTLKSAHNIHLHLDLIAGLPYETYERFQQSFDDLYQLEPDELQLGFLKVLKGTTILETFGKDAAALRYKKEPPYEVLCTNWISFEELCALKTVEEMLEIHGNSHQFDKTLKTFLPKFSSPFRFFKELGDYYESHALFGIQSSRVKRYETLFSFLLEKVPDSEETLRETLVFDYMVRELPKKYYSFFPARNCIDFKNCILMLKNQKITFDYTKKDPITANSLFYTESISSLS